MWLTRAPGSTSPSGRRIDAATPLTDPAVVPVPVPPPELGPFSVTGYDLQAPETGAWTLEVTGTGAPAPDTGYAVTALVQLPFEELVVEVEVDTAVAADVQAAAKLYAEDGTFVTADSTASSLDPRAIAGIERRRTCPDGHRVHGGRGRA